MAATLEKSLDRYDLIDRIAVGGMAEVFRAKAYGAHGFEKTIAIKRILPEHAADPEFEQRFISEAKLAVALTHANVVQVFDFGRIGGSLFIAMEYVDGPDLATLLKFASDRGERVPLAAAMQISIEIARGLDFAHKNNVVHRDVSPSNVLLSLAGEVKIADFGIALAARQRDVEGRRIMGKWRYMSPEQTRGEILDARSDIFSAATVMYELFAGEKLYPGDSPDEIIRNIRSMEIPRVSDRRDDVLPELDEILHGALAQKRSDRTPSASEIARALTEHSYRSNLVASAHEVTAYVEEAALAGVGGSSLKPRRGVDDLIRAQLAGAGAPDKTQARRTAVAPKGAAESSVDALGDTAVASGEDNEGAGQGSAPSAAADERGESTTALVRLGVDADGLTVWQLDQTVAAGPAALRGSGRIPVQGEPVEVGDSLEKAAGAPSRRRWGLAAAAIAAAGLGAGIWAWNASRAESKEPREAVVAPPPDAAPPAPIVGIASVVSEPEGARVLVDGEDTGLVTPARVELALGAPHRVEVALEGYRTWSVQDVVVEPGLMPVLRASLVEEPALLVIRTRPPGARVILDGRELGVTPLGPIAVEPGQGLPISLALAGHHTMSEAIDVAAGETRELERKLSSIQYGKIRIAIVDGWAKASLNGKHLADLPDEAVRLPVGKHRILLTNPQSGQKKTVTVEVFADRIEKYRFKL